MSALTSLVRPLVTCEKCKTPFTANEFNALPTHAFVGGYKSGGRTFAVALKRCGCGFLIGVSTEVPARKAVGT